MILSFLRMLSVSEEALDRSIEINNGDLKYGKNNWEELRRSKMDSLDRCPERKMGLLLGNC